MTNTANPPPPPPPPPRPPPFFIFLFLDHPETPAKVAFTDGFLFALNTVQREGLKTNQKKTLLKELRGFSFKFTWNTKQKVTEQRFIFNDGWSLFLQGFTFRFVCNTKGMFLNGGFNLKEGLLFRDYF